MSLRLLLTGPDLPELESRAFDILSDRVGTQPDSILYIGQQDHPQDATEDRWTAFGPSAGLRVDTLDNLVSRYYELDQYKGRVTHVDRPLLLRLVELGVEGISSPTNPLNTGGEFPRSGLVQEAETLFTELEFAGLLSPDAMRQRLEQEGVSDRADAVAELAEAIESARHAILADELPETYRTERMSHATTAETSLTDAFPSVEAVVLGGFTRFDALEADFLERLVDAWPTIALLPKQIDDDSAPGVDAGAARALETYADRDFVRRHHTEPDSSTIEMRRRITRSLYRHPDQSPSTSDINAAALNLTLTESETVPDEIRAVARDIRSQISTGTAAEDIGVVLTSPVQYADQVREAFEMYELPFTLQTESPLTETALGGVVQTVCQLTQEPRRIDTLLDLLTNPLVTMTEAGEGLDYHELARVTARVETNQLESTLEHVDDELAATITGLTQEIGTLSETPLEDLPAQLDALLERLGVSAALEGEQDLASPLRARELRARERLGRVLETLTLTAPLADLEVGDSVDRLERALHGVSIQQSSRPPDESVVVCNLAESALREFEHVYVLGVTATHFPSATEQTAFTRPIYEAHPDFEQTDVSTEARYHLSVLLGRTPTVQLSVPQQSASGDPHAEADILTELRRLVDLAAVTLAPTDSEPGCPEDIHRAIGDALPETSEARVHDLLTEAVEAGSVSTAQQARIQAGIACAAARAGPELTSYDGQLTAETVSEIHDTLDREPYSPSRLETYAACGFKYYMRRVLGIEASDRVTREPDASDRGSYIHDVLEHYYRSLQTSDGEPVHPRGDFETRQQQLLDTGLERLDNAFDDNAQTAFQREWLTTVLAGLGTPDTNPYYGPRETRNGRPIARGLFYRFLDHEAEEPGKTTARPTWFEGRIGSPYDAGTPLSDDPAAIETPHGTVPIHGLIDRVETVPGTDPTQVVVRDYKTGSAIPSETDALSGQKFQLQLYALMAEAALDDIEVVGGAYYQVAPPGAVSSRSGLLTSQEMAVYYGSDDDVDTPLLRYSHPYFETHEAFRQFIEETTPRRLGELVSGIEAGQFQPTVLDPADAGCRYCDYAHVCDVRPHQRKEVIDVIDGTGASAYVPLQARSHDLEDVVEAE
ncbi:PD-(D/E)XK nuclease family protein [Halorubrum lipolyticum]|uniref:PD-(D/E)XK nuclease family protein n=1 Tax=Halorubrum lipolyticum TaxID=368624 RepID=UPI000677DFFB|nr:PD-(D/E)XK nuclease family protein [Halorubrum lipolyticum]